MESKHLITPLLILALLCVGLIITTIWNYSRTHCPEPAYNQYIISDSTTNRDLHNSDFIIHIDGTDSIPVYEVYDYQHQYLFSASAQHLDAMFVDITE